MFSATWPHEVQKLCLDFCRERPIHIQIGDYELAVNDHIRQHIFILDGREKQKKLIELLDQRTSNDKVLIFS